MKKRIIGLLSALFVFSSALGFPAFAKEEQMIVKNHSYDYGFDTKHSIQLDYPIFSGFEYANQINEKVQSLLGENVAEIKKMEAESKKLGTSAFTTSLMTMYDYTKMNHLLSLCIDVDMFTGGAHGNHMLTAYTMNTKTGTVYKKLSDLFQKDSGYNHILTTKILAKIKENPDMYFPNAADTIREMDGSYNFFLDGNEIVIYFNEYDIAPYAAGRIYFRFPVEEWKDYLKEEIYTAMKDAKPLEKIRINGTNGTLEAPIYTKDYTTMVPLQTVSTILGYEIKLTEENQVYINGSDIRTQTKPEVRDNIIYVPVSYFTDILHESIHCDYSQSENPEDVILKIFTPEIIDKEPLTSKK